MYFNCGWPARRARVSQVNQPVGEISCASRNRVSRDSSWTLPRASLLSYPAAAPVPFSLDTRHLIKKQNDSRASPRSTLLAFQTIIPETATGVRVSESLLPRLSGGALLLWRKETRRGFWELHEFIIAGYVFRVQGMFLEWKVLLQRETIVLFRCFWISISISFTIPFCRLLRAM